MIVLYFIFGILAVLIAVVISLCLWTKHLRNENKELFHLAVHANRSVEELNRKIDYKFELLRKLELKNDHVQSGLLKRIHSVEKRLLNKNNSL
jgi:hypothetical protein